MRERGLLSTDDGGIYHVTRIKTACYPGLIGVDGHHAGRSQVRRAWLKDTAERGGLLASFVTSIKTARLFWRRCEKCSHQQTCAPHRSKPTHFGKHCGLHPSLQ